MSELIRTPAVIAGEINLIKEQVRSTALQASIEIGRRLQEAKNLVPVGDWHVWLADNVDYSVRTAQNLMALAAECDAGRGASLEKFPYSKAVLLLSMPQDERDEFVEEHDIDGMSVRELKAQIDALKEKNNELQISMDELLADQNTAEGMKAEIEELKGKLKKATEAVSQAQEMQKGIQQQHKEAADKLRKELKSARDEAAQAKSQAEQEKKQLEKALKDAKQPIIQQVTPPDVEKELAELRARLNRSQEEQALRAAFDILKSSYHRLTELLCDLERANAALAGQFRTAFGKGLRLMAEEMGRVSAA